MPTVANRDVTMSVKNQRMAKTVPENPEEKNQRMAKTVPEDPEETACHEMSHLDLHCLHRYLRSAGLKGLILAIVSP